MPSEPQPAWLRSVPMTDSLDTATPDYPPEEYEAALWHWLDRASAQWTPLDTSGLTATQSSAITRLVLSGQVQLRQQITARGREGEPHVRATCVVTGDYKQALLGAIRGAVPEFGDRVVIHPPSVVEYRLSAAGAQTQSESRRFGGGGELEEGFLSESLQFVVPGVVNIMGLEYDTTKSSIDPPSSTSTDANAEAPGRKAPAWPASKTDGYVAAYVAAHKRELVALGRDVLDDRDGAVEAFGAKFGPAAIARAITEKVAADNHPPCRPQAVHKTHTYRNLIQPLIQNPPRKPVDWAQMLEDRTGDELPEMLADIPFEDEDP